eukprot:g5403.t1
MLTVTSDAGYRAAFGASRLADPFITHYALPGPIKTEYSRGDFLRASVRAMRALRAHGVRKGDAVLHFFSGNSVADLAFRLAAVFLGCCPATVNWDADTVKRVLYKLNITGATLVLHDSSTDVTKLAYLKEHAPHVNHFDATSVLEAGAGESNEDCVIPSDVTPASQKDSRIIIFTSGTTGNPKGVSLTYDNYECNRNTFEQFLMIQENSSVRIVVVNPLHHTNSSSFTDWMLRRPKGRLVLFQRYTTSYWEILSNLGVTVGENERVVAPAVSRHFDFLESLADSGRLPLDSEALKEGLQHVDFLLGSAPVGPSTVARLQRFTGKLPLVRFGSTETCLQVMGTPRRLLEEDRLSSFKRGWDHVDALTGEKQPGYFIGQQHPGHTEVRVVMSVDRASPSFMVQCEEGVSGYIVTRGRNVMKGYVGNEEATARALAKVPETDDKDPWYLNLGDVGFWLRNPVDSNQDIFWMTRETALLIRGGSNYAYEQINAELTAFLVDRFSIDSNSLNVAVVGLKVNSEHEDDCCVTIELSGEPGAVSQKYLDELAASFLAQACAKEGGVSKGAKPSHVRFASIPRNFKGAILVKELRRQWEAELGTSAQPQGLQGYR